LTRSSLRRPLRRRQRHILLWFLVAGALLVASCGGGGDQEPLEVSSPDTMAKRAPSLAFMERGLRAAGASKKETDCIVRAVPDSMSRRRSFALVALDAERDIVEFGSKCVERARLVELASAARIEVTRQFLEALSHWTKQYRALFEEAGASSEEAHCLARIAVLEVEVDQRADTDEVVRSFESNLEQHGISCVPRERLTTILRRAFSSL
jgi:hypothetical protein